MILSVTAERTGGVCMPCKKGIREKIDESKENYQKQLKYFYKDKDGAEKGPVGTNRLVERMALDEITGRTLVREKDSSTWIKFSEIPKLEFTEEDYSEMKVLLRIEMTTNAIIGFGLGLGLPIGLAWFFDLL